MTPLLGIGWFGQLPTAMSDLVEGRGPRLCDMMKGIAIVARGASLERARLRT